jgi:transposase-like protein
MARTRPPDFMDRLIDAGLKVFGRKGLKAARMSDVARELGVSQGTLYNYVESKEARTPSRSSFPASCRSPRRHPRRYADGSRTGCSRRSACLDSRRRWRETQWTTRAPN